MTAATSATGLIGPSCKQCGNTEAACARKGGCCMKCTHMFGEPKGATITRIAPNTGFDTRPIGWLKPHPRNVRTDLGDLTELAQSIKTLGLIQPIVAAADGTVIAGHRRLAAAKQIGLEHVPVVVRADIHDEQVYQAMLIENLHRVDLTPLEEAKAYHALVEEFGLSQRQIAQDVGRDQSHVARRLLLLTLPAEVQGRLTHKEISPARAVQIARELKGRPLVEVDRKWATMHLDGSHALAEKVRATCAEAGHTLRRRVGQVGCGECWEVTIRADERSKVTA